MRSNTAELRDLLHQVLSRRSETEQIIELQSAGQHVAEQFMAAGQEVCPRFCFDPYFQH